jgi:hypothetical protein
MPVYLERLRDAIESASSVAEIRAAVEALAPALELAHQEVVVKESYPEPDRHALLAFTQPVEARALCEAMGWERAYACSTDVHQQSWYVQIRPRDAASPYSTAVPEIGIWIVRAYLTARPLGDHFEMLIGPSAAYDMYVHPAQVDRLTLQGWRREWTVAKTGDSEKTKTSPKWLSVVRSWFSR